MENSKSRKTKASLISQGDIIRLIDHVEDQDMLKLEYQKLLALLGTAPTDKTKPDGELEESLRISFQQIADDKVIPHEKVMAKYRDKFGL